MAVLLVQFNGMGKYNTVFEVNMLMQGNFKLFQLLKYEVITVFIYNILLSSIVL